MLSVLPSPPRDGRLPRRLDRLQGEEANVLGQRQVDAAGGELQRLIGEQRFLVQPVEVAQGWVAGGPIDGAAEVDQGYVLGGLLGPGYVLDEDGVGRRALTGPGER